MYIIYILHVLHDITYIYNIYKASVSPDSVQQIMSYFLKLSLQRQSSHLNGRMLARRQV
jgi:dynactin complex subunit